MEQQNYYFQESQAQNQNPAEFQNQTYVAYEALQPFNESVDMMSLLEWIKGNLEEKALWTNNLEALNALRRLNKYHTQHMNQICGFIWRPLLICLSSTRSVIAKSSMIFIQELFHHCGTNLHDDIIKSFEPALVLTVHSEKSFLKQEAQKAYQIMIEKCVKDATIVAVCLSCKSRNPQIAELSMKALERMIGLVGQNIVQIQPSTFKELFLIIIPGLDGKRAGIYKSSENLVKIMYQNLGDAYFSHLINAMINESIIKPDDLKKLNRVFETKESKPKESLSDVLKKERSSKFQTQEYLPKQVQQQTFNTEYSYLNQQSQLNSYSQSHFLKGLR